MCDLNRQKRHVRAEVNKNIEAFSKKCDRLSVDADADEYEEDEDTPESLLKEDVPLDEAIARLAKLQGLLENDCRNLKNDIKEQEQLLTKCARHYGFPVSAESDKLRQVRQRDCYPDKDCQENGQAIVDV